jgi:hypothetical protein
LRYLGHGARQAKLVILQFGGNANPQLLLRVISVRNAIAAHQAMATGV